MKTSPSTADDLRCALLRIDGQGYPAYKALRGVHSFDGFDLHIDHVQGDPYAAPSRVRTVLAPGTAGIPDDLLCSRSRRVAVCDYLTRRFADAAKAVRRPGGSGTSGLIEMTRPGPEILERTSVWIHADGEVEARFRVGLPARGRRISGPAAVRLLCDTVPRLVGRALVYRALDASALRQHVEVNEDQDALRAALDGLGLVAFVADGAVLPRASGVDSRPLSDRTAVPFVSPASMRVAADLPHAGRVEGMGIAGGVTLVVGGGFHGKSTFLQALEAGVYNHVPGDGRERVVTVENAVRIRAEAGRSVTSVCLSPFIRDLPGGKRTDDFSTDNASGSTSQASSILEAVEAGSSLLLMDEDSCAANFMVRDARMQALVPVDREPITPFVDRVRALRQEYDVSTVLVTGGTGDYLDVCDRVVAFESYVPQDRTGEAARVAERVPTGRTVAEFGRIGEIGRRVIRPEAFRLSKGRSATHVRRRGRDVLETGSQRLDLRAVSQVVSAAQLEAIGRILALLAEGTGSGELHSVLAEIFARIDREGLDCLQSHPDGDLARPRLVDAAAALNRLHPAPLRLSRDEA